MFESFWRDVQEFPLGYPFLKAYDAFMNIRRYEKFPFYVYPTSVSVSGIEDRFVKFLDYLVDAHELERNKSDAHRSFYQRAYYVYSNFHRYSNDTMANLMFDTKLSQPEYDKMNSLIDMKNKQFYLAASLSHVLVLAYMSYLLRYRRLGKLQTLAVGSGYYYGFGLINNLLYTGIVDLSVNSQAKKMGLGAHV